MSSDDIEDSVGLSNISVTLICGSDDGHKPVNSDQILSDEDLLPVAGSEDSRQVIRIRDVSPDVQIVDISQVGRDQDGSGKWMPLSVCVPATATRGWAIDDTGLAASDPSHPSIRLVYAGSVFCSDCFGVGDVPSASGVVLRYGPDCGQGPFDAFTSPMDTGDSPLVTTGLEVCNSVCDQLVYIAIENTPQLATKYASSTPQLDNLFTINLPTHGQKVKVHRLSCKLTHDLQPIAKNTPERAIVIGDCTKHCRSVVANQIATNRAVESDLVGSGVRPEI